MMDVTLKSFGCNVLIISLKICTFLNDFTMHSQSCREVMHDLQVNCMFGNMYYYPTAVSIDNGPYFVLFRDLSFHHVLGIDNINCLLLRSGI